MNELSDVRENFLYCLDLKKLRLKNLPNFVFLCGGCTKRTTRGKDEDEKPEIYQSMRKAALDVSHKFPQFNEKIVLAENYQDWHSHGTVKNLIDFELAIADMAGAIVLILEAPGAYAELGSFSVLKQLAEKLILVVNEKTMSESSYITLGPIKYLEDNSRIVLRYNWDVNYIVKGYDRDEVGTLLPNAIDSIHEKAALIVQDISDKSESIALQNPTLDYSRNGHLCFIIGDLIYSFLALKLHEIVDYLETYFEIKDATTQLVKSCLYILTVFEFIEKKSNGDVFYVATAKNKGFIKYSYSEKIKDETGFATLSDIRVNQFAYYSDKEKSRFNIIDGNSVWN
ncbi:retron St85 family effector protein [Vibrio splendidus]